MKNFISFIDSATHKKPFHIFEAKKGAKYHLNHEQENYIFFVISGSMLLKNRKGNDILMQSDYMYALCKLCAPYQVEIIEDLQIVVLLADSLANHINIPNLSKILSFDHTECTEVPHLKYNQVFKSYLHHILLLENCCDIGSNVHELKKMEYLHYMRKLYSKEELAKFTYGIVSTYSDFKMSVYKNYNNATNVEKLAESLFMTTKTFTRRFKQEFNSTPHKWILEQKIYHLNHFITNEGVLVPEILKEFDFPSVGALKQFCKRNEIEHLLEILPQMKMN